jgi:hypothetical protein
MTFPLHEDALDLIGWEMVRKTRKDLIGFFLQVARDFYTCVYVH